MMKKLLRPLQDALHNNYEKMTFYKAPRGRSKKVRKYEHVDLTKEFELRQTQRNALKQSRLEELYAEHDLKALEISDLISLDNKATEEELAVQREAQNELLGQLREDRHSLVKEFEKDTDLKQKVVI